jgi:membrane-bound metal-dependent hydrolase YbcI (DUF457 family)
MPSPLGHALGAVAAGWTAGRVSRPANRLIVQVVILAALGVAPDLDLLSGRHRGETHSIGAAVIAGTVAAACRFPIASTRPRIWLAAFAAWGSHVLFDALGTDLGPPSGLMAFWPLSTEFVKFEWEIFLPLSRSWQRPGFVERTVIAVLRELVILGPLAAIVAWWRRPRDQAYS